jgi:diadenylate cyclase
MAFRRIGALIVIEKKNRLNDLINSGEIIDSLISLRLILAIFSQKSVLHDGAIIVRNDRILAAKAVLPLTKNIGHMTKFGTRHLAAIGITEVSDALAIVVSEQTGRISIAVSGAIQTDVAFEELMQIITDASR